LEQEMTSPLSIPHVEGLVARQAHADIPEGSFERELGREGFSGPAAHMYHRNPPTAWLEVEGPIRPRALKPRQVVPVEASPWNATPLMGNDHVAIRYWRTKGAMDHLARNSDGDELVFVHSGSGHVYCDYGHLAFEAGDYLMFPRGTMWRFECDGAAEFLLIEATDCSYRLPDRGLLGRHAMFDPGVMDIPAIDDLFRAQPRSGRWPVKVKRNAEIGTITYPFNPLDAIGWKGDLYPVRLNIRHIRAVTSARLHLPPSARTTFSTDHFVVCTLSPRPMETDPGAIKLPFFHNNEDCDEVIFYHKGNLGSRGKLLEEGAITYHPRGITHGPHPEVLPFMLKHPVQHTDSYSIMIDTFDGLKVADLPEGGELTTYGESWRGSIQVAPDATARAAE
jgi:homogentisate 1,2-dioxygenase